MTNPCILHVEDDDNDIFLFERALQRAGVSSLLQIATDGQMAMDYLAGTGPFADRSVHPLPTLVLLDLKLPKKPGLEVLQWIRRHPTFNALPVIVFTSSASPADAQRAYAAGANSFVVKPADIHHLSDFARRLKEWWLETNQPATPLPTPQVASPPPR